MADPGFPAQHTTTTVTSNTRVQTNLRYDPSYFRKKEGIIKIVEIALCFIGFICIQCTSLSTTTIAETFASAAMIGVWVTAILLVLYLFHVVEKLYRIPWIMIEMWFCGLEALFLLIVSCMTAPIDSKAFQAAAFFGFCAMVVYAGDTYLKFLALRSGKLAQGERQISKETTTVSSPAY